MTSLRSRVTLVTVAVAVIAVLVTALISLQLVRSSTTQEARDQLAAQADLLARVPNLSSAADLADRATLALGGAVVALVLPGGGVEGGAREYVDAAILAKLASGESVSTTRRGSPGLVMLEARPLANGGGVVLALPMSGVDRALGMSTSRILAALAIGLVVAAVGGTVLGRMLSRPLTDTAAAARRLAAGERGVEFPPSTTIEVADMTAALAALDAALASSEGRQREFLLSISHELRTPLTALRGYGEALADGLVDDPEAVGRTLVSETERLDRFVADLLELARLEADDFTLSTSTFEVSQLIGEVADAWRGQAETLGLTVSTAAETGTLTTDRGRLRQVIDGLVENALRAGGSVTLRYEAGTVAVRDTGPGLSDEDLAVAFDRGVLRGRYRDIRPVGTGLGLSIAARLVTRLGGTLSAANHAGGGAEFRVTVPSGTEGRSGSPGS